MRSPGIMLLNYNIVWPLEWRMRTCNGDESNNMIITIFKVRWVDVCIVAVLLFVGVLLVADAAEVLLS